MTSQPRRAAGELEAEILAVLWGTSQPLSPGDVREQIGDDLAYTTVMTILSRLHDKGVVRRERVGRAYLYTPALDEADLAATRMRALLEGGRDRQQVLARFVGSLSSADERLLASALRRSARRRSD
jgi:predicted transcriptional regulator